MIRKYIDVIVAICLLVAFQSVWLGIWGPLNTTALSDWQTLMGSVIALGAATLAYRGAMAKVNFDRDQARRLETRKTVGILMKVSFAADIMQAHARWLIRWLSPETSELPLKMTASNLRFDTAEGRGELMTAYEEVEHLPRRIAGRLDQIRRAFYKYDYLVELVIKEGETLVIKEDDAMLVLLKEQLQNLVTDGSELKDECDRMVVANHPE